MQNKNVMTEESYTTTTDTNERDNQSSLQDVPVLKEAYATYNRVKQEQQTQ